MFSSDLAPLTHPLPATIAASVGATLARHAYLDWVLGQVMYSLMEISIRQGRVILKLPRPRQYVAAVRDLFAFHNLPDYDFERLARRLEAAESVRSLLTRSSYMHDGDAGKRRVYLTRSLWDPGPGGEDQPEDQLVDRRFLAARRKEVESAIASAEKLREHVDRELRRAHELRTKRRRLDRRAR